MRISLARTLRWLHSLCGVRFWCGLSVRSAETEWMFKALGFRVIRNPMGGSLCLIGSEPHEARASCIKVDIA